MNLTRLVDGDDFWINQVYDSLWPLQNELNSGEIDRDDALMLEQVVDFWLVIAIALPGAKPVLLDSVSRKTTAVAAMADALGLSTRVEVLTERIETTAHDSGWRNSLIWPWPEPLPQHLSLNIWCPCSGLRVQHCCIAVSGAKRRHGPGPSPEGLHAKVSAVQRQHLPGRRGLRHVLCVRPTSSAQAVPRAVGLPAKFPSVRECRLTRGLSHSKWPNWFSTETL